MSSLVFKASMGVASVGGIVGAGILVNNHLLSKEDTRSTIGDLLAKSKTKIVVKEDAKWNELWTKYKSENKSKGKGEDSWKLEEWEGTDKPESIPNSYKNKCQTLFSEKVEGEGDSKYLEFLNRCARDKNVGDLLKGFSLLPTDKDDAKWKNRFKKYKQAKSSNTYPISAITLADSDSEETSDHLKKLKDGCSNQWNKSVTGNEEESYLEAI
ncbi:hypothetical protein MHC_01865 [Mycoplasma haemocanis str. Illinois]|uniref:Uncharacterized protein n=1 Tax=Mycoplasma haemocanis (strain Illinois) TaxID=1111676 RepID=H6N6G7_MYCHN|nr:hypothetical protein MHC_01865 [Mycoplasma haemocanis str. Illinois]